MVHLHPSRVRVSGEHHLPADNRATEHRRKGSTNSHHLATMALLHRKAVMGSLHHSNMVLHRPSNPGMAPLHLSSTVLLPVSSTALPRVSARPLSPRWGMALSRLQISM